MRNAEEAAAAEAESLPDLIAEESSAQAVRVVNTAHVVRGFPPEIIITLVVKQRFFFKS